MATNPVPSTGNFRESPRWLRIGYLAGQHGPKRNRKRTECRLYRIWHSMRVRCKTKGTWNYDRYGAKGIQVCAEWDNYEVFREWAVSNGYRKGLSLDRYPDSSGDYCPENCRWATREEQAETNSQTIRLTLDGVTKPLPVWAREYGLTPDQLRCRIYSGWDTRRAITQPLAKHLCGPRR